MTIKKRIAKYLAGIPFIYNAVLEKADLSAFKKRPAKHVVKNNIIGLALIIISYIIGWPVIISLGILSFSRSEPLLIIVGGPAAYIVSHLLFIGGMYLVGAHYSMIFLRWAVRKAVEAFIGRNEILSATEETEKII